MARPVPEVRDPMHGAIPVADRELAILDHPLFQRLRHIRQLGFSDLSFPGATHTRYLHSIGVMHLAGRAFDQIFTGEGTPDMDPARRATLRRLTRLAALLHDVGHAPFSHASEFAMPLLSELGVRAYATRPDLFPPGRQATHEDYTIKILTDSSLARALEADGDFPPQAIAGLVDSRLPVDPDWYRAGGVDWRPLLQQLISSELDVDRMDYLGRDSHFAGVHYGVFDVNWLLSNLSCHVRGGQGWLALRERAVYAFDDFLIARHHMFLMVYFHYRSVVYEEMLKRYFIDGGDGWRIPASLEEYVTVDDSTLLTRLRNSRNPWARRIVERREYKLLLERHGEVGDVDLSAVTARLQGARIPVMTAESKGQLSKYFQYRKAAGTTQGRLPLGGLAPDELLPTAPIYVLRQPYRGAAREDVSELDESTRLFERYAAQRRLSRVYVPPEFVGTAGRLIDDLV